jgi:hypothetical protein
VERVVLFLLWPCEAEGLVLYSSGARANCTAPETVDEDVLNVVNRPRRAIDKNCLGVATTASHLRRVAQLHASQRTATLAVVDQSEACPVRESPGTAL